MSDLVERLSIGNHSIEVSLRPERTLQAFRDAIDRGYVHILFTGTRGGTELSVHVDRSRSSLTGDFERGVGQVTIVGDLSLDFVKVRCTADVDLATLSGYGRLEPTQDTPVEPR